MQVARHSGKLCTVFHEAAAPNIHLQAGTMCLKAALASKPTMIAYTSLVLGMDPYANILGMDADAASSHILPACGKMSWANIPKVSPADKQMRRP